MFLSWPSIKIIQAIMIRQKAWPPGTGFISLYIYIENFITLRLVESTGPISIQFIRNVILVTLYQICSSHDNSKYAR